MLKRTGVLAVAAMIVFMGCDELGDGSFASFLDWMDHDSPDGDEVDSDIGEPADSYGGEPADSYGGEPVDSDIGEPIDSDIAAPADSDIGEPIDSDIGASLLCADYCAMEAGCIPECLSDGGTIPCDSPASTAECESDCIDWAAGHMNDDACAPGFSDWMSCITTATCEDVETFFHAHPDDVEDGTPCGEAYEAMDCMDFEPRTEYSFD